MTQTKLHVAGLAAVTSAALLSSVLLAANPEAERFWPQWRGPYANGVSRTADPPLEWSETKNIRWKIEIPGRGSSSPVVWGDRLFVTTAIPMGVTGAAAHEPRGQIQPRDVHQFRILAIDRRTGRVLWERTPRQEQPRAPSMKDGTWASSSAITDGRRVFAFFDSSGLYAYDMQGTQLWEKHFGDKKIFAEVGESAARLFFTVTAWSWCGTTRAPRSSPRSMLPRARSSGAPSGRTSTPGARRSWWSTTAAPRWSRPETRR